MNANGDLGSACAARFLWLLINWLPLPVFHRTAQFLLPTLQGG